MYVTSLARLREICLALPEATEVGTFNDPIFKVRDKIFAMGHRVDNRESVWFKASTQQQQLLLARDQQRFFTPPYLGKHGWLGCWLDDHSNWPEVTTLVGCAYRMTAPSTLVETLPATNGNLLTDSIR